LQFPRCGYFPKFPAENCWQTPKHKKNNFPNIKSLTVYNPAIEGRVIFLSSKCHKIGNIIIFLLVITIYGDILGILR